MSQSVEEVTFVVLRVTRFENLQCALNILEESEEAKVVVCISAWLSSTILQHCLVTKSWIFMKA